MGSGLLCVTNRSNARHLAWLQKLLWRNTGLDLRYVTGVGVSPICNRPGVRRAQAHWTRSGADRLKTYSIASNSTSKTSVLLAGIFGLGLFGP